MNELHIGNNSLNYDFFIVEDSEELLSYTAGNFESYKELQRKNRGIIKKEHGGETINTRIFAEYCLKKRITIFRMENGNRYAYNYAHHMYEIISENTLGAILLKIIEEYSNILFGSKAQEECIRYIDFLCESFTTIPEDMENIVFQNGTYNIDKNSFTTNFSEEIFNTYVMTYDYEKEADCKKFKHFLSDIFNKDEEVIAVLQEIFGYTFCYGASPIDKFFFFWSTGRSGKSVLANVLRHIHGVERVSALSLDSLEQRFQLSSLIGKVVNITPEGSQHKLFNTSILKALTGRDAVLVEEKYKLPYTTVLNTKLIIVANHYLNVSDDSFGFWQRVLPIPFPNVYLPLPANGKRKKGVKYQNVYLEDELLQELSGIFNWAMQGLARLKANNWSFTYSQTIEEFKNRLMLVNKPVEIYLNDCIEEADFNSKIKSSLLHSVFIEWATENELNINEYYDSRKFHRELKSCLQTKGIPYEVRKNSVDYYYGIKFNDEIIEIDER